MSRFHSAGQAVAPEMGKVLHECSGNEEQAEKLFREMLDSQVQLSASREPQTVCVSDRFYAFHVPCRIAIFGKTQSGKSRLMLSLIGTHTRLFDKCFHELVYCYSKRGNTDFLDELRAVCHQEGIIFTHFQGMPQESDITNCGRDGRQRVKFLFLIPE